MKKKTFAVISVLIIAAMLFAGCSSKGKEASAATAEDKTILNTDVQIDETATPADSNTDTGTSNDSSFSGGGDSRIGSSSESTSSVNSGKDTSDTSTSSTSKASGNSTTTKKVTTTKGTTTTKKETTKKPETTTQKKTTTTTNAFTTTTTSKNVSPAEVQKQVNAYIKSKGIAVDSSMTPSNASWTNRISRTQNDLNSGYSLEHCRDHVDWVIKMCGGADTILSMYCYVGSDYFYILYW